VDCAKTKQRTKIIITPLQSKQNSKFAFKIVWPHKKLRTATDGGIMRTITELTVVKGYGCLKLGNQLRGKIILMKEKTSQLMMQLLVSYSPWRLSSSSLR
jgi:hypothetical protein